MALSLEEQRLKKTGARTIHLINFCFVLFSRFWLQLIFVLFLFFGLQRALRSTSVDQSELLSKESALLNFAELWHVSSMLYPTFHNCGTESALYTEDMN